MRKKFGAGVILAILVTLIVVAGCGRKRDTENSGAQRSWTPAPITGTVQLATETVIPVTSTPEPTFAPTETRPVATATATTDPSIVIITEDDVLRAVTSGVAAENGADLQGVGVEFTQGKMRLTADRASYGFISVDNLELIGRLVASNGKLQLQTESISPGGIVTALIPTLANQALQNYTSKWYIDDVQTLENRLQLHVRR